ncbi:capsid protein [Crucivirus-163]|nr:capsid protein [Crucivirus-163]
MPRKVSKKAGYTQAQKLAYYKAKAARSYRGRGDYYSDKAPKSYEVGGQVGESVGNAFNAIPGVGGAISKLASPLTKKLGQYLGSRLGSYFGWGSYKVNMNSLTVPEGNSPASMHSNGMITRICHREYFGDVISSSSAGAFKLDSYKMQPGAPDMFPWLSDIAPNFQKYRIRGAIVEFKSGSGDAITGTNTALGEIICSTNYNTVDPNFTSRNQMENTQYCSSAKPSVSFVHVIECDPSLQAQENLYTSSSTTPITGLNGNDINWCNVQVASIGCQGTNVNLGSLYITYDIELIQPIEFSAIRRPYTDIFSGTAYTDALPIAQLTADPANSLGGTTNSSSQYSFPKWVNDGIWMLYGYWQSSGGGAYTPPVVTISGGSLATILINDGTSQLQAPQTGLAAVTRFSLMSIIKVTSSPCIVTVVTGVIGGATPLNAVFIVNAMDASFLPALTAIPMAPPAPTSMKICKEPLHSRDTIREEYHTALKDCEDAGESEIIERLKRRLAELENKSPALAYQVDRLNHQ